MVEAMEQRAKEREWNEADRTPHLQDETNVSVGDRARSKKKGPVRTPVTTPAHRDTSLPRASETEWADRRHPQLPPTPPRTPSSPMSSIMSFLRSSPFTLGRSRSLSLSSRRSSWQCDSRSDLYGLNCDEVTGYIHSRPFPQDKTTAGEHLPTPASPVRIAYAP